MKKKIELRELENPVYERSQDVSATANPLVVGAVIIATAVYTFVAN